MPYKILFRIESSETCFKHKERVHCTSETHSHLNAVLSDQWKVSHL